MLFVLYIKYSGEWTELDVKSVTGQTKCLILCFWPFKVCMFPLKHLMILCLSHLSASSDSPFKIVQQMKQTLLHGELFHSQPESI